MTDQHVKFVFPPECDTNVKTPSVTIDYRKIFECIECGSPNLQREGKCMTCRDCGWSKCAK